MTHGRIRRLFIASVVLFAGCGDGREVPLGWRHVSVAQGGRAPIVGNEGGGVLQSAAAGASASSAGADAGGGVAAGGISGGGQGGVAARGCDDGELPSAASLALLQEVVGFALGVTGGALGCVVHVTSLADSGPGTLREAASSAEPAWVVFDVDGDIPLASPIFVESNKTLDGRGRRVTLRAAGLSLVGVSNVVIESLSFSGGSDTSEDAISLSNGSSGVWIDHCSLSDYSDGLVDVVDASSDVTVSWSHFFDHEKVMLLGESTDAAENEAIRVTMHHNWFDGTYTYHPRLRFGRVHSFNNLFEEWGDYATGSSMFGQLVSEANIYLAGGNLEASVTIIGDDTDDGFLRSVNDSLLNGAVMLENEPALVFEPSAVYPYSAQSADAVLEGELRAQTGPR